MEPVFVKPPAKSRQHLRTETALPARFRREGGSEFACTVLNVSPANLAVITRERGTIGDQVVVYIGQLGRVEGEIIRLLEGGFAIKFTTPPTPSFLRRVAELQKV